MFFVSFFDKGTRYVRKVYKEKRLIKATVRRMTPKLYPEWDNNKRMQQEAMMDFHALRYTFCTQLIREGINIKTVQRIMGHENIQTTLNIYAQYCPEDAENIVDKLPW